MAPPTAAPNAILTRAINVYALPKELLDNLIVRSIQAEAPEEEDAQPSSRSKTDAASSGPAGSLRCQACPDIGFETVEDQRAHFKSDWHRYNVKARMTGRAVSAEEWEGMVEGVSSISGSASSSSGSSDESQSKVSRLLRKAKLNANINGGGSVDSDEEAEVADRVRRAQLRTAVIWFSPSSPLPALGVPQDTQFGIHRSLFPPLDTASDYLGELRRMQLSARPSIEGTDGEDRRITLLMVAGGHFAGMVVGLKPRGKGDKMEVKGAGEIKIFKHKTFHRYTTRKKQGGSQALNDNAKSKAVSAGAMLRRYGEAALQEEIRQLMSDWEEDIAMSERVFIRASTHGRKSFVGYEGAVLEKNDARIRVFPFPTRRPTLQELLRCWHELVRTKVSHLSSDALQALDDAYIASLQPRKPIIKPVTAPAPSAPSAPIKTPDELAREDRQRRLSEMIKKGRLDALRPFWEKHQSEFDNSALGLACTSGQEDIIRFFLDEIRLDPTVSIDGKKPYDLCSTRGARNVFRRTRYEHEEWYDWAVAHVPSGLSEEMEEKQDSKKAERRKGLKEKLKEREKARSEAEAAEEGEKEKERRLEEVDRQRKAAMPTMGGGGVQKLGGRDSKTLGMGGMSEEMRMRVERERRAKAAEARFANLGAK